MRAQLTVATVVAGGIACFWPRCRYGRTIRLRQNSTRTNRSSSRRQWSRRCMLVNPHSWIYVDVKMPNGTVQNWAIEAGSPNILMRRGITQDSLKVWHEDRRRRVSVEGRVAQSKRQGPHASRWAKAVSRLLRDGGSVRDPAPRRGHRPEVVHDTDPTTASATTIGRYRVVRLIAHGGMGSLYLARDPAIDRLIAIKLLQEGFDDEAARERFAREARATGGLRHPNIVTVFDVGEHDKPAVHRHGVRAGRDAGPADSAAGAAVAHRAAGDPRGFCARACTSPTRRASFIAISSRPTSSSTSPAPSRFSTSGSPEPRIPASRKSGDQLGTLNYMSPEQVVGGHLDHRVRRVRRRRPRLRADLATKRHFPAPFRTA